jgi:hypothetical protein
VCTRAPLWLWILHYTARPRLKMKGVTSAVVALALAGKLATVSTSMHEPGSVCVPLIVVCLRGLFQG